MTPPEITCNLCQKNRFTTIENDEEPYKVLRCLNCSLVFVYPFPDYTDLKEHYNHDYYKAWVNEQKKKRIKMWGNRLKELQKIRQGGRLLDVGCGEGTFLKLAKRNGWHISGTELSAYAVKYATDVLGADIFCGEIEDAGYPENSFDIVTMWHVLEHVRDPNQYLNEIRRVLRPDGLLVIAVPNVNNLIMQIAYRIFKGRKMKLFSKDEKEVHLYHFSPDTIKAYLDKSGFECLRLSPDFGIMEASKKLVNLISVIPYYLGGIKIFNAIEVYAAPK